MSFTPTVGGLRAVGITVTPDDASTTIPAEMSPIEVAGDGDRQDPPILSNAHVAYSPPAVTKRCQKPVVDKGSNSKRQKTSVLVDEEEGTSRNIILPLDVLQSFLCDNSSCKTCRTILKPTSMLGLDVFA
jgi:hypothetical protein